GSGDFAIEFQVPFALPAITVDSADLTPTSGNTITATITQTTPGVTPNAAAGIDRIDSITGGHDVSPTLVFGAGIGKAAGSNGGDILFVTTDGSTLEGLAGNDLLVGGDGFDKLVGGPGNDFIAGGPGKDTLLGGPGNDTIQSGLGEDHVEGNAGDDHLIAQAGAGEFLGGIGNDTLEIQSSNSARFIGGEDDDTFLLQNGWGKAEIYEFSGEGDDTIDFSNVTDSITHVLTGGALTSGTNEFTPSTSLWERYLTATGDSSGTFATGGNELSVPFVKQLNPVQKLNLGNADGGTFTLTYDATTTSSIAYKSDATTLASDIQKALNTALKSLKKDVRVTALSTANQFNIEFVDHPTVPKVMTLATTNLTNSGGSLSGTALEQTEEGQGLNEVQTIDFEGVTGAPTGNFKLRIGDSVTGTISAAGDAEATRAAIETALNNLSIKSGVLGAISGLFGDSKYNVTVTLPTVGEKTFRVQFHTPNASDVRLIEVLDNSGNQLVDGSNVPYELVATDRDGKTESRLANIENLVAANADNRFIFGDNWGVDYSFAEQFLPTFLRDDDSSLTIDTSPIADNGHNLTLDFRNVTNPLNFEFSSEEHSVQTIDTDGEASAFTLTYSESQVVKLDLKGTETGAFKLSLESPPGTTLTTAAIKILKNQRTTAYNIERAIEAITPGFNLNSGVSVDVNED
ncbi:MAG: hypothetical protein KDB23_28625, partial [Planctomycetales bacterium]|nr:hypothetical protein [Planctomycetales bacterium]